MKHDTPASSQPRSLLAPCGSVVLIGLLSALLISLTVLFPPWLEVHCERRQVLFVSHRVKVHETSFAGFDYIFAKSKWEILLPKHGSGEHFESVEFDLYWPLLVGEWVAVIAVAGICYIALSIVGLRLLRSTNPRLAEQSDAREPTSGPDPNAEPLPPAR